MTSKLSVFIKSNAHSFAAAADNPSCIEFNNILCFTGSLLFLREHNTKYLLNVTCLNHIEQNGFGNGIVKLANYRVQTTSCNALAGFFFNVGHRLDSSREGL